MKKFKRWVLVHNNGFFLALSVLFFFASVILLFALDLYHSFLLTLLAVLDVFLAVLITNGITKHYMKTHTEALDHNCDPYPLLEEVTTQLAMVKKITNNRVHILINASAAYTLTGQQDKALSALQAFDMDAAPKLHPITRCMYYQNLSSVYTEKKMYFEANEAYSKMQNTFDALPNEKMKSLFSETIIWAQAENRLRREDYEGARRILSELTPKSKRNTVEREFMLARIALGLCETEKAKAHLHFVIENGNKLHIVSQAKELLTSLS